MVYLTKKFFPNLARISNFLITSESETFTFSWKNKSSANCYIKPNEGNKHAFLIWH